MKIKILRSVMPMPANMELAGEVEHLEMPCTSVRICGQSIDPGLISMVEWDYSGFVTVTFALCVPPLIAEVVRANENSIDVELVSSGNETTGTIAWRDMVLSELTAESLQFAIEAR